MAFFTETISEKIHQIIANGFEAPLSDEEFNEAACGVFAYQYEKNIPYRQYCAARGCAPHRVRTIHDIPAVPTGAFREITLACFPESEAVNYFETSGTTAGKQGRHYVRDYTLYEMSLLAAFRRFMMPDLEKMEMLIISPPPAHLAHSSLAHMFETVRVEMGDGQSAYYMDDKEIRFEKIAERLNTVQHEKKAVMLLGTSLAFRYFCGWCKKRSQSFILPEGSRLMDTGGTKGKFPELPRQDVAEFYMNIFGIPEFAIINEYGMTELFSQYYDNAFFLYFSGKVPKQGIKQGPPWLRSVAVDPQSLQPLPDGSEGFLRHFDLANIETLMAVQTEDIGFIRGDELILMGRDLHARPRGCSLTVDEIIHRI